MIEIKHLRKAFGERVLFDDLSIVFPDGALVGLFGPSGCGKTTFLNLVSLLEPLDAGELVYAGKPYADLKKKALEKYRIEHFSYIFPEASLLPALNVYENVLFPSRLQGLPLDEGKARGLLREPRARRIPRSGRLLAFFRRKAKGGHRARPAFPAPDFDRRRADEPSRPRTGEGGHPFAQGARQARKPHLPLLLPRPKPLRRIRSRLHHGRREMDPL